MARLAVGGGLGLDASLGGGVGISSVSTAVTVVSSMGASWASPTWSVGAGAIGARLRGGLWGGWNSISAPWERRVGWYGLAVGEWRPKREGRLSIHARLVASRPLDDAPIQLRPTAGLRWVLGGPR